jgi:hypothetical protein
MRFNTFHLFPELPVELRLIIWYLAGPDPRVVEVSWIRRGSNPDGHWIVFCPLESASPQCNLLFTNKEARNVYLESWTPIYPCISRDFEEYWRRLRAYGHYEGLRLPTMYFNPKIDTLYIPQNRSWDRAQILIPQLLKTERLTNLRFLAVDFRAIHQSGCSKKFVASILPFKKLESFSAVWGEEMFSTFRSTSSNYIGEITLGPKPCTSELARAEAKEFVLEPSKRSLRDEFEQRNVKFQNLRIWRGGVLMSPLMTF